jgi:2,4-dienoyl-CoA reductase (NADPH2)
MPNDTKLKKLLEPYHIGKVKTRNRMFKTAAGTGFFKETDMHPNAKALAYYEALARGGIGLLIMEASRIDETSMPNMLRIDDDRFIPAHRELTEIIHKHGCPTFIQLYHFGPLSRIPGQPIAASAFAYPSKLDMNNLLPRALTISEIKDKVNCFAEAAVRAQKAGFDGVEINAGSSHLLATFLSRFWNKRDDFYGRGSLENRARIVVEIIQEIKKRLGADFPVSVLTNAYEINVVDFKANGECLTIEESQSIAQILEKAGADAIHVRIATIGNHVGGFLSEVLFWPEPVIPSEFVPPEFDSSQHGTGAFVPGAAMIKKAVSIPVMAVGRLDPILGDRILREGKVDFIGFNRRLIADPELPNKIAAGKLDDIAPCTACVSCFTPGADMHCRINAACGYEDRYALRPAEKKKRVLVVGGGPSGMESARVAALRGHQVTLYDKNSKLGGLLPVATMVKGTEIEDLPAIINYLTGQIAKLGVDIKLGQEVNLSTIEQHKPDVVILAGGGLPSVPNIPGITHRKVVSNADLHKTLKSLLRVVSPRTLRWLTRFWMPLGKRVVIMGGNIQGCQLAQFLVKRGRKVTIVEEGGEEDLGKNMTPLAKIRILPWLQEKGVSTLTGVKYEEITNKGLTITNTEGKKQTIEADNIVIALPLSPDTEFPAILKGKVSEVYCVGDCREPKLILDAISDGSVIARKI